MEAQCLPKIFKVENGCPVPPINWMCGKGLILEVLLIFLPTLNWVLTEVELKFQVRRSNNEGFWK